jgi:hypothetical protein
MVNRLQCQVFMILQRPRQGNLHERDPTTSMSACTNSADRHSQRVQKHMLSFRSSLLDAGGIFQKQTFTSWQIGTDPTEKWSTQPTSVSSRTQGLSETIKRSFRHFHFLCASTILVLLTLAPVIWLAHFLHSPQFGLYEDDWYRVPKALGIGWHGLWSLILASAMPGPSQGRPLHPAFIYLFSFLGFKLDGLQGVYAIAFLILLSNALLFYSFLRRSFHNDQFAFLGALSFSLFPADTTQPFLTHALGLQPAITLLLIAFHCYLSGWKKRSYVLIFLTLFTYETTFLLFVAAPLIQRRPKKEIARHLAIMAIIFVCVVILRSITGEARVSHLGYRALLLGCFNMVVGPVMCVAMYVYRPIETLLTLKDQGALLLLWCWIGLTLILARLGFFTDRVDKVALSAREIPTSPSAFRGSQQLIVGLVMLVAAYPLTMTTTAIAVAGRGTRVHTCAVLGASLLLASACSAILSRPTSKPGRYLANLGVAGLFVLLMGFGLRVQQDYVLGWQEQRGFWTDLIALCPDLNDGDVIFVEPTALRDTRQLLFLRKSLTGIPDTRQIKSLDVLYSPLPQIYDFPGAWKAPPRVFRLPLNWKEQMFARNGELRLLTIESGYSYFPTARTTLPSSKAIFLDTKGGHLNRRSTLLNIFSGRLLVLKKDSSKPNKFHRTSIANYLILPPNTKPTPYLAMKTSEHASP